MVPHLLPERIQVCRAQVDEDISYVQCESEEIKWSVNWVEHVWVHGDPHRNEGDRVHGDNDNQVAPAHTPLVRAGHYVLALTAAFLPCTLPLRLK